MLKTRQTMRLNDDIVACLLLSGLDEERKGLEVIDLDAACVEKKRSVVKIIWPRSWLAFLILGPPAGKHTFEQFCCPPC
jgi:hypothetical protein